MLELDDIDSQKNVFHIHFAEDAEWCRVANPDCSKLYTQQACKNYCSISEGNLIYTNSFQSLCIALRLCF